VIDNIFGEINYYCNKYKKIRIKNKNYKIYGISDLPVATKIRRTKYLCWMFLYKRYKLKIIYLIAAQLFSHRIKTIINNIKKEIIIQEKI
jgi:hypothetical protein